ncbi:MAG: primosomal protein N' [Candidatus Dasytiphilus stammeri]
MLIVQVAIYIPIKKYFDYLLPSNNMEALIGRRVYVPFGNRKVIGIIVNIKNQSKLPLNKLKTINDIIDNKSLFPTALWRLLLWAAEYYQYPLGEVLFQVIPKILRKGNPVVAQPLLQWQITELGRITSLNTFKNKPNMQKALAILQTKTIYQNDIIQYKINKKTLNTLILKGLCNLSHINKPLINNLPNNFIFFTKKICLNYEQITAIEVICRAINKFSAWLLAGITGSGKTEVYLNVIAKIITSGRQVLVLVPEINLIHQTVVRFQERFNLPIDVLHSGLNDDERFSVWLKARQGEVLVVIGTRLALFTPFASLGIIVIDEEHDSSYKQQEGWCYQARDLAVFLARESNIPIIMGSATPALETLYNVDLGKYKLLRLSKRAGNACLSKQHIIDLKGLKLESGLSPILIKKISKHLENKNQVLLFLNRRGYSTSFICHECGWIAECQRCDHYYTLHQQYHQLYCHYCESKRTLPSQCIQCGTTNLIPVGLGTEQIEQKMRTLFPTIPLSRIDRDTVNRKATIEAHYTKIHNGGAHILVGTQMLAKGHHFPNLTLVALLNVDGALLSSNFRSTERFAQLYTQVAGRAGRTANKYGEVLLQTYHPHNPVLHTLLNNGYESFATQVLKERKMLLLPPYTCQVLFKAESYDNDQAIQSLYLLRGIFTNSVLQYNKELLLMGPIPALQAKRRGRYRWQLVLQHPSRGKLQKIIKHNLCKIYNLPQLKKIKLSLDVDPIDN